LFAEPLPSMTLTETNGKYRLLSGKELDDETRPAWAPIEAHIKRFLAADIIVISTPMWNFGMPYVLKHYIDVIVQPRYLFKYTENGPVGLAGGRKVIVVTTRGGDYSEGPAKAFDQLEPSLRVVLGFIGISDPIFINAQPMLGSGPEIAAVRIQEGRAVAGNLSLA
ncbi:MAG TPA: NAD(P)H-dependent oxidoreductase, partial [Candidatus Ozemobacteraceae bacterium]|nr:NAD(P)H-dependent oxidoreductase [Candidatus Ozemobacteraceae bacterium]